jgi:hypothetical protein
MRNWISSSTTTSNTAWADQTAQREIESCYDLTNLRKADIVVKLLENEAVKKIKELIWYSDMI